MEKSSKRGKIPQSDWPSIMARYEAGETLSSIARTYDCSPPAISYVVSRSRARQGQSQTGHPPPPSEAPRPVVSGEPQLIKASAANGADHAAHREPTSNPLAAAPLPHNGALSHTPAPGTPGGDPRPGNGHAFERPRWAERDAHPADPRPEELFARPPARPSEPSPATGATNGDHHRIANGDPRSADPRSGHGDPRAANGDQRGRLHLALGNGNGSHHDVHHNGGSPAGEPRSPERPPAPAPQHTPYQPAPNGSGRPAWAQSPPPQQAAPSHQSSPPQYPNGGHLANGGQSAPAPEPRKESAGSFIDRDLRARVDADIAAFLAAFDVALAEDSPETRAGLREATDRLLRAGARTRIELERLEARTPLPPREGGRHGEAAWRQR
jgi:transposase-like protein